jgi:hypothetical protein
LLEKSPKSVDEAVEILILGMSEEELKKIREMDKDDLIELHFNLGMFIRNSFGLWGDNDALIKSCMKKSGVVDADPASSVIIKALWKKIRN